MKRFVSAMALTLALTLSLTGCGGDNSKPKAVDLPALAETMVSKGGFENELLKMSDQNVADFYDLTQVDSYVVYLEPTGGSAEEMSLFQAKEGEGDTVKALLEKRIASQKEKFENYVPGEIFKLENAVICQSGDLVALVVSTDPSGASSAFDEAVK